MAESGVTQRVAAILAADAVGYSRLMAADEPATIDALDAARAVFIEHIESNHGRVVDTAGDSVLAVFETTEGAAVAAVAIQASLAEINAPVPEARQMPFRIGLHLGDIREKADGTVYGDGVNVAARLEGLAEPGRIVVSGSVHDSIRGRHGLTYHFLGEQAVKNIAEPVRAYLVLAEGETAPAAARSGRRLIVAGAVVAVLALVVAFLWPADHHESLPEVTTAEPEDPILAIPSGPSIAVLPFENLSGDTEQDYFVDGISEDILTQLSQFEAIKVIARNSTFQFKGQAQDVREIGRRLGAQYVLEGSVRRGQDQLRISAQLLNAQDGSHMWAKNYDRGLDVAALFDVQDEITSEIAGILASTTGVISRTEIAVVKRKPPESLEAYECILLAHVYQQLWEEKSHLAARNCLERTVEADPTYAEAWAWLGHIHVEEAAWGYNAQPDHPDPPLLRAELAAKRALDEDRRNQRAHLVLASIHYTRQDMAGFVSEAEQGLAINPNDADALGEMAWRFCYGVDWTRGLAMMEKAKAINPLHPPWYHIATFWDSYGRGLDDEALVEARKAEMPGAYPTYANLAAVYGQLGRHEEAATAIAVLLDLYPDYPEKAREELYLPNNPEYVERHLEGLEKAGLFDEPEAPTRPIIAVLPFDSMSEDPAHQFFADGIAEDIITRLARFPDIGVIARNSSFQYQGENVDVRAVADALGATYVLEGSVRRSENDIRVIAQLLDASDGTHVWAETYDRDLSAGSVFEIQDDITERVVGAIASAHSIIAMAVIDASNTKPPADLASYECVMRAMDYWRVITPDVHLTARTCLERVIAEEPDYAAAYVVLAGITTDELIFGYNPQPDLDPPLDRALRHAESAIELDPKSGLSQIALARVTFFRHDLGRFRGAAEQAIKLAPNDAMVLAVSGSLLSYSGSWARGLSLMERAVELNPHHQTWYFIPPFYDALKQGDDGAALAIAQRINMPGFFWTHLMLAAAYGQLGMASEAAGAVATLQELWPGYTIQMMVGLHRVWNYEEDVIDRMADGLRKAGLPEGTD